MKKFYVVSSKFDFGCWEHIPHCFETEEEAKEFLETEEYDFREREIVSRSKAIKLCGKKAVENAENCIGMYH